MLIDRYMPSYHFIEKHSIRVEANPDAIYRAIHEVRASEIPFLRVLFGLRGIPAMLVGRGEKKSDSALSFMNELERSGFMMLEEQLGQELVIGVVGNFWRPVGNKPRMLESSEEFLSCSDGVEAKAVMNFCLHELSAGGILLTTETRIQTEDPGTRRKFGIYWAIIYPGSAWIRRMMLRTIKYKAERAECK